MKLDFILADAKENEKEIKSKSYLEVINEAKVAGLISCY